MDKIQQYDKPFKTYDEQISILESRNVIIDDYDFARRVLSGLSYYTIVNGYKIHSFHLLEPINLYLEQTLMIYIRYI